MAVFEYNHPLIKHKLTNLRNEETDTKLFRESLNEIASLMVYEATRNLETKTVVIKTPIEETKTEVLKDPVTIVPILRAGLGMVEALLDLIPNAKVGHLGVYRDETTFEPVYYYAKMPSNVTLSNVFVVDPMLATGGSIIYTIEYLLEKGVPLDKIKVMSIIAAPEGIAKLKATFPELDIYVASIDRELNEHKYICPGLGDAGDRIFGTK